MSQIIRSILLTEAVSFFLAGPIHFGTPVDGCQHRPAAIAESLIPLVLLAGLVLIWLRPEIAGLVGLVDQRVALLENVVGAFTIPVGVGPRTVPDVAYDAAIMLVLCGGLLIATRTRDDGVAQPA